MSILSRFEEIEMSDFSSSEYSISDSENSSCESHCDDYAPIPPTTISKPNFIYHGVWTVEEKDISTPAKKLLIPDYNEKQPKKYVIGSGDDKYTFMCYEGSMMSEYARLSPDNLYDEYEKVLPCNDDVEKAHDVIDDVDIIKRDTQNKAHILMSVSDNNPDTSTLDCLKIKYEGFVVNNIDSNGNRFKKFIKLKEFKPLPFVITYKNLLNPDLRPKPEPIDFKENKNIDALVVEKVSGENKVNELPVSDKIDLITRLNLKFKDVPNDEIIYCDNFIESFTVNEFIYCDNFIESSVNEFIYCDKFKSVVDEFIYYINHLNVVNEFIYCDKFKSCSFDKFKYCFYKYIINNYNVDLSYDKPPDIYRFINHYNYGNVELNLDKPPDKWFVKKNLAHIKDMFVLNVELSYNKPPDIDEFIYDTFAKLVLKYNVVY